MEEVFRLMAECFANFACNRLCDLHDDIVERKAGALRGVVVDNLQYHMEERLEEHLLRLHQVLFERIKSELHVKTTATERIIDEMFLSHSEALPLDTRFVFRKMGEVVYVIEQQPRVVQININDNLTSLSVPYVVFFVHLGASWSFKEVRLFFRRAPLEKATDTLHIVPLPNINEGKICAPHTAKTVHRPTVAETVQEIIAHIWGGGFRGGNPLALQHWEMGTLADPNFAMTKFQWDPSAFTVETMAQKMLTSANQQTLQERIRAVVFSDNAKKETEMFLLEWLVGLKDQPIDTSVAEETFRQHAENWLKAEQPAWFQQLQRIVRFREVQ